VDKTQIHNGIVRGTSFSYLNLNHVFLGGCVEILRTFSYWGSASTSTNYAELAYNSNVVVCRPTSKIARLV